MTVTGVASDPVPAVVGTSASGSLRAQRLADAPERVEILAGRDQIGGELGDIHRAAAAEADDRDRSPPPPPPPPSRSRATGSCSTASKMIASGSASSTASASPSARTLASVTNRQGPGGSSSAQPPRRARPRDQLRSVLEFVGLHGGTCVSNANRSTVTRRITLAG